MPGRGGRRRYSAPAASPNASTASARCARIGMCCGQARSQRPHWMQSLARPLSCRTVAQRSSSAAFSSLPYSVSMLSAPNVPEMPMFLGQTLAQ